MGNGCCGGGASEKKPKVGSARPHVTPQSFTKIGKDDAAKSKEAKGGDAGAPAEAEGVPPAADGQGPPAAAPQPEEKASDAATEQAGAPGSKNAQPAQQQEAQAAPPATVEEQKPPPEGQGAPQAAPGEPRPPEGSPPAPAPSQDDDQTTQTSDMTAEAGSDGSQPKTIRRKVVVGVQCLPGENVRVRISEGDEPPPPPPPEPVRVTTQTQVRTSSRSYYYPPPYRMFADNEQEANDVALKPGADGKRRHNDKSIPTDGTAASPQPRREAPRGGALPPVKSPRQQQVPEDDARSDISTDLKYTPPGQQKNDRSIDPTCRRPPDKRGAPHKMFADKKQDQSDVSIDLHQRAGKSDASLAIGSGEAWVAKPVGNPNRSRGARKGKTKPKGDGRKSDVSIDINGEFPQEAKRDVSLGLVHGGASQGYQSAAVAQAEVVEMPPQQVQRLQRSGQQVLQEVQQDDGRSGISVKQSVNIFPSEAPPPPPPPQVQVRSRSDSSAYSRAVVTDAQGNIVEAEAEAHQEGGQPAVAQVKPAVTHHAHHREVATAGAAGCATDGTSSAKAAAQVTTSAPAPPPPPPPVHKRIEVLHPVVIRAPTQPCPPPPPPPRRSSAVAVAVSDTEEGRASAVAVATSQEHPSPPPAVVVQPRRQSAVSITHVSRAEPVYVIEERPRTATAHVIHIAEPPPPPPPAVVRTVSQASACATSRGGAGVAHAEAGAVSAVPAAPPRRVIVKQEKKPPTTTVVIRQRKECPRKLRRLPCHCPYCVPRCF